MTIWQQRINSRSDKRRNFADINFIGNDYCSVQSNWSQAENMTNVHTVHNVHTCSYMSNVPQYSPSFPFPLPTITSPTHFRGSSSSWAEKQLPMLSMQVALELLGTKLSILWKFRKSTPPASCFFLQARDSIHTPPLRLTGTAPCTRMSSVFL